MERTCLMVVRACVVVRDEMRLIQKRSERKKEEEIIERRKCHGQGRHNTTQTV